MLGCLSGCLVEGLLSVLFRVIEVICTEDKDVCMCVCLINWVFDFLFGDFICLLFMFNCEIVG